MSHARLDDPGPSAPRGHGPQGNRVGFASSWLHPLKSWSLRETRCGALSLMPTALRLRISPDARSSPQHSRLGGPPMIPAAAA
ncbi:hypothetical protein FPV16_19030 [Methylobacterium sp. W2]|nr:hypothetical protein [Methylobacterium sp. W2]